MQSIFPDGPSIPTTFGVLGQHGQRQVPDCGDVLPPELLQLFSLCPRPGRSSDERTSLAHRQMSVVT
jgi:hypothetical protein